MKKYLLILFLVSVFISIKAQNIDTLCIKNASIYQNIVIGMGTSGFIDMPTVISQIKNSKTDFIFRAFWRWGYVPDSAEVAPDPSYELRGYTYKQLKQSIRQIKDTIPDIIICGALPAYMINKIAHDDLTGEIFDSSQTWSMALDPQKWGINFTKDSIQNILSNNYNYYPNLYPDITNTNYQRIFIDWAKKQINCGVDAIWIDLLYHQSNILQAITGNINHISVQESFNAASAIVDSIHHYGNTIGKNIYVGTWNGTSLTMPYAKPHLDFVTTSVSSAEVYNNTFDSQWTTIRNSIIDTLGKIPILVCIDFGFQNSPLNTLSQHLSSQQQREFIANADTFFYHRNMTFVYPLLGGNLESSATILSFGQYPIYCSFAPEFNTYDTIITLGSAKSVLPWYCSTATGVDVNYTATDDSDNLFVYPNPTRQMFTVELPQHNFNIAVFDLTGIKVFEQKNVHAKIHINSKGFPGGIYLINVTTDKQIIYSKKLFVAD